MKHFKITVSIITYNRKDLLIRTLGSLERQSLPKENFEVVIVDDGSTDETPLAVKDIIRNSPCSIKYIRQEVNQGKSVVRNISIDNAQGELILFIEDDTIADEHLIEEHLSSHLSSYSENIAVFGSEIRGQESIVSPIGKYIEVTSKNFFNKVIYLIESNDHESYRGFITFNLSIKKSFLNRYGKFDPEFKYFSEDIELGYRLVQKGLKIICNQKAVIYNHHPANLAEYCSRNFNRGVYLIKLNKKHPEVFKLPQPVGKAKRFTKGLVYPSLMIIIDFIDRRLKIPFPGKFYQRIMDYYIEKGVYCALNKG